jgi:ABC-type lipoprotein export system ATPase subunit
MAPAQQFRCESDGAMILLDNVTKIYTASKEMQVPAVQGVSLDVACGEFVVITGRSGCGKTTLLNLAAGLTQPTAGRVLLAGQDLWQMSDAQRSRLRNEKVGFVFQFPSLLPSLTVLENVTLPTVFYRNGAPGSRERGLELLARVGLSDKADVFPRQLSAGQQQRVVVARALFNQPEVLFADEPTSNLDEQTEHEIMDLLAQLHRQTRVTILLVTHTAELVRYGTRAVEMAAGGITP